MTPIIMRIITPPATPPAIAPVESGELSEGEVEDGEVGDVDVGMEGGRDDSVPPVRRASVTLNISSG